MNPLLAFIPFLLIAVIWLIVVKKMKKRGKGAVIRHLTGFVLGMLGGIISIVVLAPKPSEMATENRAETVDSSPKNVSTQSIEAPSTPVVQATESKKGNEALKSKTIGLTPKQFAKLVNQRLKSYDFPAQLPTNPSVTEGKVNNIAQMFLVENLGITLSLDKQANEIKGITTILSLTDNLNANLLLFGANASVISSFAGEVDEKNVGAKFLKLSTEAMGEYAESKDKATGVKKDFIHKGMKFGIIVNELMGIYSYAQFEE